MQTDSGFGSFAVVDVETSGLSPGRHRVLSVAALLLDPSGAVVREFHSLVDPGEDPGPVHVHGLTREILRGAPDFGAVRERLAEVLAGRVLVAHNARFDHGFLAAEFRRTGARLPVARRMCTVALARRVAPPTADLKLRTLAAHYGVRQQRAHDALDDTRVLAGVLRGLVEDATRLGIAVPVLDCSAADAPRQPWPRTRSGPKPMCGYRYPGRLFAGEPLVQGMKVAFSGDTGLEREVLVARAEAAGLDVTGAVSGRTSVLVCNEPGSRSGKMRRARDAGTLVVSEGEFLRLLRDVAPGVAVDSRLRAVISSPAPAGGDVPEVDGVGVREAAGAEVPVVAGVEVREVARVGVREAADAEVPVSGGGPLSGRRVLVLGGTHADAAAARAAVTRLGGAAAVNLSARVTDVLALPGGRDDRRLARVRALGLPVHGAELVRAAPLPDAAAAAPASVTKPLSRGQVIDLPARTTDWTIRASWHRPDHTPCTVDLVAFLLDHTESTRDDADFVFYNQPEAPGARLVSDGPDEQAAELALDDLPAETARIVIAAALDGPDATFGDLGPIELEATTGTDLPYATATLDAATDERTLLLAEIYRRDSTWRLRAVGQGYPTGLADLARGYGVDVAD